MRRASSAWRRYGLALALLAAASVALILFLPVLPGQDLPQHLAYARIFLDYRRPDLAFRAFYALPPRVEPYFLVHLLLARLGRVLSIGGALKLVLSLYALATLGAFHALVAACQAGAATAAPPSDPPWSGLFGALLVFGPLFCLGFLPYFVCCPIVLAACALLVCATGPAARPWHVPALVVCVALATSLHLVAGALFVLVALVHAAVLAVASWRGRRPDGLPLGRRLKPAIYSVGSLLGAILAWQEVGGLGAGSFGRLDVKNAVRGAYGLELVNGLFRLTWYDPPVKLNYVLWHLFGPYRFGGLGVQALATIALVVTLYLTIRAERRAAPSGGSTKGGDRLRELRTSGLVMALLGWLAPFAIGVPSELSFIDFRLFTLALALLLASVPSRLFATGRAQIALALFCLFSIGHFAFAATRFAYDEAMPVRALLDRARPRGVMMPLVFHGRSAELAKIFQVTHALPMYYTVDEGGISSQFWARYTEHLPIGYRDGVRIDAPPDWDPGRFERSQLASVDYVLLQSACDDDPDSTRSVAGRILGEVEASADELGRAGLWRLFRVRHPADSRNQSVVPISQ